MKKILFLGISHRAYVGRLYYRQVCKILDAYQNIECIYIGKSCFTGENQITTKNYRLKNLKKYRNKKALTKLLVLLKECISEKPDWIQASDVRELIPALIIKLFTGAKVIYDAHEDYFNQSYEYRSKSYSGLIIGCMHRLIEILFIRFTHSIFCTDDYLFSLYRKKIFAAKQVSMQRNFVDHSLLDGLARPPSPEKPLRLVYIGNVNEYRGLIECAFYVSKYNQDYGYTAVTLDVFSPKNYIIGYLNQKRFIQYHAPVPHPDIFKALKNYHIGVFLFSKIRKFERNLGTKNFEYMSVGLPVLTSDYGNMARYVKNVHAGICINPDFYTAFKAAIDTLRREEYWALYSKNGVEATGSRYQLMQDLVSYLSIFKASSDQI